MWSFLAFSNTMQACKLTEPKEISRRKGKYKRGKKDKKKKEKKRRKWRKRAGFGRVVWATNSWLGAAAVGSIPALATFFSVSSSVSWLSFGIRGELLIALCKPSFSTCLHCPFYLFILSVMLPICRLFSQALKIFTFIGCGLSIFGLALTILFFLALK